MWIWRRTHPITKERLQRSVGRDRAEALRQAAQLDADIEALIEGRPTRASWDLELGPLVERYLEARTFKNPRSGKIERTRLTRVVGLLQLEITADLRCVARIDDMVQALDLSPQTMRTSYQQPLKRFSAWLAENQRVLEHDPLSSWKPIPFEKNLSARRAATPAEFARALAALEYLAVDKGHAVSQRPLFVALLVTGARSGAVVSRTVEDLKRSEQRIYLGESQGRKRRGYGALDPRSFAEIDRAARGRGPDEPLFRGPQGRTQDNSRLRDLWLASTSLAFLDEMWPSDARRDLKLALYVSRSLMAGRVQVGVQGNPNQVSDRHREAMAALRGEVAGLYERLQREWEARRERLPLAAIRKTHYTWAAALGVPSPSIDVQVGHSTHDADAYSIVNALRGSRTGRTYYLDRESPLIEPQRSAQAVRDLLDDAERDLYEAEGSLLGRWLRETVRAPS